MCCRRPAPHTHDVSLAHHDVDQFFFVFHFIFLESSAKAERFLRNRLNAPREVHFVPANCTTSKRIPRMPRCAHRYTVDGCSFAPFRRRGTNGRSGTCASGISSSCVASIGTGTPFSENIRTVLRIARPLSPSGNPASTQVNLHIRIKSNGPVRVTDNLGVRVIRDTNFC